MARYYATTRKVPLHIAEPFMQSTYVVCMYMTNFVRTFDLYTPFHVCMQVSKIGNLLNQKQKRLKNCLFIFIVFAASAASAKRYAEPVCMFTYEPMACWNTNSAEYILLSQRIEYNLWDLFPTQVSREIRRGVVFAHLVEIGTVQHKFQYIVAGLTDTYNHLEGTAAIR